MTKRITHHASLILAAALCAAALVYYSLTSTANILAQLLETPKPMSQSQTKSLAKIEEEFNRYVFQQQQQAYHQSEPIHWRTRDGWKDFFSGFPDMDMLAKEEDDAEVWEDTTRDLVFTSGSACRAVRGFRNAGSVKKHILFAHFNDNWGAFSGYVENRTVNWGSFEDMLGGCSMKELMEYLDHNNTLGVITVQFQQLDHPKVHSIPLGASIPGLKLTKPTNKTRVALLSVAASEDRKPQIAVIEQNFNGTVVNTHFTQEGFHNEVSKSKFVFSPSGMDRDCYRNWEALHLGSIPIIEHHNRSDGWFRSFQDLPVLFVPTFDDVTPELLEREYLRLTQRRDYNFNKLTKEYWINFIHSLRDPEIYLSSLKSCTICDVELISFPDLLDSFTRGMPDIVFPTNNNSARLAYGPFIPKSGSTSTQQLLQALTENSPSSNDPKNITQFQEVYLFSFIRHPVDRFLAGYHQFEIFHHMGWIDPLIKQHDLKWWNTSCFNTTWTGGASAYKCFGNVTSEDKVERLERLNHFLDEILSVGFYDDHLAPMTYLLKLNHAYKSAHKRFLFDLKDFEKLNQELSHRMKKPYEPKQKTMSRPTNSTNNYGMHWAMERNELLQMVNQTIPGAREVLMKICHLLREDIKCLRFDVPECE